MLPILACVRRGGNRVRGANLAIADTPHVVASTVVGVWAQ